VECPEISGWGSNRIFNGKNEIECQGRKRGIFSAEFKEEAARMVVETSRSIARAAVSSG